MVRNGCFGLCVMVIMTERFIRCTQRDGVILEYGIRCLLIMYDIARKLVLTEKVAEIVAISVIIANTTSNAWTALCSKV